MLQTAAISYFVTRLWELSALPNAYKRRVSSDNDNVTLGHCVCPVPPIFNADVILSYRLTVDIADPAPYGVL